MCFVAAVHGGWCGSLIVMMETSRQMGPRLIFWLGFARKNEKWGYFFFLLSANSSDCHRSLSDAVMTEFDQAQHKHHPHVTMIKYSVLDFLSGTNKWGSYTWLHLPARTTAVITSALPHVLACLRSTTCTAWVPSVMKYFAQMRWLQQLLRCNRRQ